MALLHCDVLVVGLGPTGAALAGLLGAHGISTLVIDREPALLNLPRAVHFDGEVMRIFQNMGIAQSLLPVLRPSAGMQYVNARGLLMLERKPAAEIGAHGWANNYLFHQPDLENCLRSHLRAFGSVQVMTDTELISLDAGSDAVMARILAHRGNFRPQDVTDSHRPNPQPRHGEQLPRQTGSDIHEIQAAWVIGCDGARSRVREHMRTELIDLGLHQEWLVVDVELLEPVDLPAATVQYCDPARPITYVNVTGHRRRWEIMIMPGDDPEALREPGRLWPLLARWVQPHQVRLVRSALYTFHSLITQQWRDGRLLLAGDSAHQTPPFLGQGMCAGIRDAANLAWKLAAVVNRTASPTLLDSYMSERLPHAREFIDTAIRLGTIIQTTDPAVAAQRDRGFSAAGPQQIVNLSPRLGAGCHSGAASAGGIAPQPRLSDGRLLDDRLTREGFACVSAEPLAALQKKQLRARFGKMGISYHADPSLGSWLSQLGARFVLLRPDRYVAATASSWNEIERWPIEAWGFIGAEGKPHED